jgi:hypothetical protein
MEKPLPSNIRLGTRTYFFNLVQSSAQNLFVLDFTRKISLGEVGIKTAGLTVNAAEKFQLATDPFDKSQVEQFLSADSVQGLLAAVAECLETAAEKESFGLRKRWYTYIISNESNIVDVILQTLDKALQKPPMTVVYMNHFEIEIADFLAHFETICLEIKSRLSSRGMSAAEVSQEMQHLLLGVKLTRALSQDNKETYLLKRGREDLLMKYPFLAKEHDLKLFRELKRAQAFPNEIIDSFIYLGNGRHVPGGLT